MYKTAWWFKWLQILRIGYKGTVLRIMCRHTAQSLINMSISQCQMLTQTGIHNNT